jgi:hypothetical protein
MIFTKIEFNGTMVRVGNTTGFGFRQIQMLQLGQLAVDTIKARVARAVGSDDAAMKPLGERYKKWKTRIGLQPIRDLHGPGATSYMARTYNLSHPTASSPATRGARVGNGGRAWSNLLPMRAGGRPYLTYRANIRFRSPDGGAHMLDNFTVRYADELTVRMDITAQWARDRARANEQRAPWFGFSPNDIRVIAGLAQQMFHANVTDLAVQLLGQKASAVWLDPYGLQDRVIRKFAA